MFKIYVFSMQPHMFQIAFSSLALLLYLPFLHVVCHGLRPPCFCLALQVYELGLFLNHSIMMNSVAKPASSWSTKILQFEGSFFFVRSEKKDGNYTVDVVMKGLSVEH